MLGHKQRYKGYQNYITQGVDEDIKRYYCHYNILSVLGSPEYRQSAIESSKETELDELKKALINKPDTDEIIKLVCHYTKTNEQDIRVKPKGKRQPNAIRSFAMFACRRYGDSSQKQIAEAFQLQHPGGSSFSINKIKKEISQGLWKKEIEWLKSQLNLTL